MTEFRAFLDPAETRKLTVNFFPICANFWAPNEIIATAEFIRPNVTSGFAYQATAVGTTGRAPPRWPQILGQTVVDGSITWTATTAGANGVFPISAPAVTSDPAGLTIASVAVVENTKIEAVFSGGILGQEYDAVYSGTIDGRTRIRRVRITIARR